MSKYAHHAKHAMRKYLERGLVARTLIAENKMDELCELLQTRNAAFHNFRVFDALAQQDGIDIQNDPEVLDMWQQLGGLEKILEEEMGGFLQTVNGQLKKIKSSRKTLGNYKSQTWDQTTFQQSV